MRDTLRDSPPGAWALFSYYVVAYRFWGLLEYPSRGFGSSGLTCECQSTKEGPVYRSPYEERCDPAALALVGTLYAVEEETVAALLIC